MEKDNVKGTVVVKEKRRIKDIMANWYNTELKRLDEITPEEYDRQLKERKHAVQIAGGAATVALVACPADGPFGEVLTLIATPVIAEIVEGVGKMMKPIVFGLQKKLRGTLIKSDKVTAYEFDSEDFTNTSNTLAQNIETLKGRAI